MKQFFLLVVACISFQFGFAQKDSTVYINGYVKNSSGGVISDLMVINKSTLSGQFGGPDGSFTIGVNKNDTIILSGFGYESVSLCYADSTFKRQYTANVTLYSLRVNIGAAEVFAPRDLQDIQEDIDELGFNEEDYRVSQIDAIQSPITFLYQMFSKTEQSKREVIELINNDKRRELLKELFALYVDFEIIELEDHQFDDFIDYMDPGDELLQNLTQYQFILYVKDQFLLYKTVGRRLKKNDYQYHLDD